MLTTFNSMLILFSSDGLSSGEASKSFPLQFGSISPGFVNGMQVVYCFHALYFDSKPSSYKFRPGWLDSA